MWPQPTIDQAELAAAEAAIVQALHDRSIDRLNVLGFGELGLAVGWPTKAPSLVLKRQAPGTPATVATGRQRMIDYISELEQRGVSVVPTVMVDLPGRRSQRIPYLVQPVLAKEQLVENILAAADPSPTHPALVAIRQAVIDVVSNTGSSNTGTSNSTGRGLSIDAQVSNFVWNDDRLHVLDTTPVLQWDAGSGPLYDVGDYLTAVPLPIRPIAMKMTRKVGEAYRTPHGCLFRCVAYLRRIDLDHWIDAAIECFNEALNDPIDRAIADAEYAAALKELPNIKRLARVQRAWVETVRKDRYQFFITNSFEGRVL